MGKSSHIPPKDFRPISLTSFRLKTLERLIDSNIRENLDPAVISEAQYAYTKGKSVETALHKVALEIEKTISSGVFVMGTFLDIEGAFNNVTPEAITGSMTTTGVHPTIRRWIDSMLSNRTITSEWAGASICKRVTEELHRVECFHHSCGIS